MVEMEDKTKAVRLEAVMGDMEEGVEVEEDTEVVVMLILGEVTMES